MADPAPWLIEAAATAIAFGIVAGCDPPVIFDLVDAAVVLRGGWANFDVNTKRGTCHLPVLDATMAEIHARALQLLATVPRPAPADDDDTLTVKQAHALALRSRHTILNWIASDGIGYYDEKRRCYLVSRSALRAYMLARFGVPCPLGSKSRQPGTPTPAESHGFIARISGPQSKPWRAKLAA